MPFVSQASAYWMEVSGSGKINQPVKVRVIYGFIDDSSIRHSDTGVELKLTGDFKIAVIDAEGHRMELPIALKADGWEGKFTPKINGTYQIIGINNKHPVVDRSKSGGINTLPVDYLCAAYNVGNATPTVKPAQYLDIVAEQKGKQITIKAFKGGQLSAKGTKLRVFNPENWEKELTLDEHGEAVFSTTMKGLYIIRQDWVDPTAGTYQGVNYANIRHRCNYCLQVQ